jgi:hypothetical protein
MNEWLWKCSLRMIYWRNESSRSKAIFDEIADFKNSTEFAY